MYSLSGLQFILIDSVSPTLPNSFGFSCSLSAPRTNVIILEGLSPEDDGFFGMLFFSRFHWSPTKCTPQTAFRRAAVKNLQVVSSFERQHSCEVSLYGLFYSTGPYSPPANPFDSISYTVEFWLYIAMSSNIIHVNLAVQYNLLFWSVRIRIYTCLSRKITGIFTWRCGGIPYLDLLLQGCDV